MEERFQSIGEGRLASHPYDVSICWKAPSESGILYTIVFSEGSAHSAMGGYFTLADVLDEKWNTHLQVCGCLWLRELAREEQLRKRPFTADEIFARWQARLSDSQ